MKSFLFFTFIFLFAANLQAYQTARQISMAGAGGLMPYGVDGLKYNPATLNLKTELAVGGGYLFGDSSADTNDRAYFGWMKDNISSSFPTKENQKDLNDLEGLEGFPLAAAFVYNDFKRTGLNPQSFTEYTVGLSSIVMERLSLGGSVTYFDGFRTSSFQDSHFTFNLGALFWVTQNLKVGLSGRDLLNTSSVEEIEENLSQKLRLSTVYSLNSFFDIYLDGEHHFSGALDGETDFGGGLETRVREFVAFRVAAYQRSVEKSVDFGFGLSFLGPKLQFHYGLRLNADSDQALHTVDFILPFW